MTQHSRTVELLDRHHARLLDPWQESSVGGAGVHTATAYRADMLVIAGGFEIEGRIRAVLGTFDPDLPSRVRFDGPRLHLSGARTGAAGGALARTAPTMGHLSSHAQMDAWVLLEALRDVDPTLARSISLNHVLTVAEQPGGNPLAKDHGRPGLDRYGRPSFPGRGPVGWPAPMPRPDHPAQRPRVVVLDTGIGVHPWFTAAPAVTRFDLPDGRIVGPQLDPGDPRPADGRGSVPAPLLGALGTHAGHGTFIAGLIRQTCPEAEIIALAVMGADGEVQEDVLTDALIDLAAKQDAEPGWADALVLSLGYYAESSADLAYTSALKQVLLRLARAGVAIFCAAGNDATSRDSFPAALAIDPDFGAPDVVPLASVAALTSDGLVAEFSNDGPWVNAEAPGVGLVSTAPVHSDGSARRTTGTRGPGGRARATMDPDDFLSGFAAWSGTSFAAPVLAGGYLRRLIVAGVPADVRARRLLVPLGRSRRGKKSR